MSQTLLTQNDLLKVERKLDLNTADTREILDLLRGPLGDPSKGLVSRVDHSHARLDGIEEVHRSVRRLAVVAAGSAVAATISAFKGWLFAKTGANP